MLLQSEAWFSWYQLAFSGVGAIFGAECQKRGMLVRVAGDNIMMSPPLIMTPDEVEEVIHQIKTHSSHHPSSLFSDHNRRTELWSSNTEHPFLTKQYFYWTSKTDELNSQATVLNNEHLFVDKKKKVMNIWNWRTAVLNILFDKKKKYWTSETVPSIVFQLVSIYGDALKATEERVAELKSKKNN